MLDERTTGSCPSATGQGVDGFSDLPLYPGPAGGPRVAWDGILRGLWLFLPADLQSGRSTWVGPRLSKASTPRPGEVR